MIATIAAWLIKKNIVGEKLATPLVWGLIAAVGALTLFVGVPALWTGIKNNIISDAVTESNEEFGRAKDEATGKADALSDERKTEINRKIQKTEDLIDEALKNGCAVAEYLASSGAKCVSDDGDTEPSTNP